MEETMMMMTSRAKSQSQSLSNSEEPITTSTCPTWKLYENPFYYSQQQQNQHHQQRRQHQQTHHTSTKCLHHLHLPLSARRIAASFWDLTFFRPVMDSELDVARAQIIELKAELEFERKIRKKLESVNKKLMKELCEERKGREAMERVCEELAKEISNDKAEISRMKKEIEEERKMLRMAEVLREERVQMKLAEAKILYEEKVKELEVTKRTSTDTSSSLPSISNTETKISQEHMSQRINVSASPVTNSGELARLVFCEKSCAVDNNGAVSSLAIQRRASPEAENPHIKRGIKGFVEFPRVVRAIGSKGGHLGSKLECQRAQLRILLKQRSPLRSNNLIFS
ncbi:hypothetical protein RJ641_001480 [Dillenia turbinata]|uniref:Protein BRANCHLESS TRICHOME n=1 Tax=Dillenia turbinata TaxID=194707 RepID=A0AAN8WGI4_9MAGN